jgi:palmitoyltransferase
LIRNGADWTVRNKQGINMLHVSAQGDQPYSLTFFRDKGLSINSLDYEQSTPLHWACFAGSDTAIYYLQSWGSKVNAQDNVGNTPLHLAVRSADHFPNTRSIKELLIKGASRSITEENGLKPIDLVDEIEDEQKRRELLELLKEPGFYIPCCHFRQPMKKIEPNNNTLACFLVLTWGTYIALLAFVHPCKLIFLCGLTVLDIYSDGWFLILTAMFLLSFLFFVITVKKQPGFMRGTQ